MMLVIVILVIIMLLIILVIMHTYNAVPTIIQPGSFPSGNQHSSSVIIQSITIPPGSIRSTLIFSHHSVHHYSTGQYSVNTHLQSSFSPSLFHRAVFGQHSSSVIIQSITIPPGSIRSTLIFSHHSVHHYSTGQYSVNTHLQSSFSPSLFHRAVFGQHSSSVIIQSITIPPGSIRSTLIFSHHSVHHYSTGQYSVNTHLQSSFSPSVLFHRAVFGQHSSSVIIQSITIPPGSIRSTLIFSHHSVHHYSTGQYSVNTHLQSSFSPSVLFHRAVFGQHSSSVIIPSIIIQPGRIPSGITLVFLVFGHHFVHQY